MEWEAGRWLHLKTRPEQPDLARSVSFILSLKPALRYEHSDGWAVWEWHTDGGDRRWQAIQGIPAYGHPVRLNRM